MDHGTGGRQATALRTAGFVVIHSFTDYKPRPMARIFISHSSANNAEALALRDWLVARGWDDLFLDIDPQRGLVSGQRWLDRLQESAQRCKAVLFVLSREWLASRYCTAESWEARKQERPLFALFVDDTAVDEVPAEMRGIWQLAFLTRGSRFETFSVQPPPDYVPTEVRFSHEGLESLRLGLAQAGLTSIDTESFPWPTPGFEYEADGTTPRRPYRGLKPVDAPDAGVFFGRDADLVRARDHLADLRDSGGQRLVVILGASGSGKSSFLRAGLLPRLARDDRHFLPLPVLRPRGAAMWGDEGLLAALETAHRKADLAVTRADLRKDLETGGAGFLHRLASLRSAAARGLPEDAKPPTLVLPIDQAEELFTAVRGDTGTTEAGLFLTRLAEILRHGPETIVLVTIRSDAYEPLQTAEALAGVPQVPFNLPPLAVTNYRSVVEGPADRVTNAGRPLTLEADLIEALFADAQGADALPLLGFTLERLYVEHGGGGTLTMDDYNALGGVRGSIEAAIAEAFSEPHTEPLIPADTAQREALLKRAFVPHLMGVNEANGEPVRRTARRADLPAETRGLIDRLIERRLLVIDRRGEETVVEVAHEALLRRWPTLRQWLDEERSNLQTQQEVARAASAWNQNGCRADSDWLTHRGTRLTEGEAVARREDFAKVFEGVSRAYLDACRQAEDAARGAEARSLARQRAMQLRVGALLLIVGIVILVGGWFVVAGQRKLAQQASRLLAANAKEAFDAGHYESAMRLALVASHGTWSAPSSVDAEIQLGSAAHFSWMEAQLSDVSFLSFSPDGTRFVTISQDWTARVWKRGKEGAWASVALRGHKGGISSASFSPDGERIVTASRNDTARVWSQHEAGDWSSVSLEESHQGVNSASFSPDGAQIVTVSSLLNNAIVRVWREGDGGAWKSVVLTRDQDKSSSAFFSRAGTLIVKALRANTIRMWSQGEDLGWISVNLPGHSGQIFTASPSQDGAHIVVSFGKTARVWSQQNDSTWLSVVLEHSYLVHSASFSPDGMHIVTTGDSTPTVWSRSEDGNWKSFILEGHQGSVLFAAFSPDSSQIVTTSNDNSFRIWERRRNGKWHSITTEEHQGSFSSAFFSPDGTRIISVGDSGAQIWSQGEIDNRHSIALKGHEDLVLSAAFSPDGSRLVTASKDKKVRVWHQVDGTWASVPLEGHQDTVNSAAFSPDGTRIVTTSWDNTARVWSHGVEGTWRSVVLEGHHDPVRHPIHVHTAAFSPDGNEIVTASDMDVRIWRHSPGGDWASFPLRYLQGFVNSALFSSDGSRIVTASLDQSVEMWSKDKNNTWTRHSLGVHNSKVNSAAFSTDSSRIVTALGDGTIHVWSQGEGANWTHIGLKGHDGSVFSAAFSSDGARIVTASEDHTARVWDVRWLMGRGDWAKTEQLSLPESVCREKLHGSWTTVKDPKTGGDVERIAERLLTADDIKAAPILAGRVGEDVCAPFLEPRPWWSRLAFWR